MKVGDLVVCNHPARFTVGSTPQRVGLLISESTDRYVSMALNKAFKVLWRDGTIGNNVWDYDLELING